jgi:hypothetical protein
MNDETERGMQSRLANRVSHNNAPQSHQDSISGLQAPAHARVHHRAKKSPPAAYALMGISISPFYAGIIRAVVYVVLTAGLDLAIVYFKAPPEGLVIYSATIVGALRVLEGLADQYLKGNASAAAP